MENKSGKIKSHAVENSLWKRLWICFKTDCWMNDFDQISCLLKLLQKVQFFVSHTERTNFASIIYWTFSTRFELMCNCILPVSFADEKVINKTCYLGYRLRQYCYRLSIYNHAATAGKSGYYDQLRRDFKLTMPSIQHSRST
jgi:hypothetical protein